MWNEPTKERLANIAKLYETEEIPTQDKEIHLHFFIGGCDWFIAETDGEDIMFGFCILNGDLEMAEWGYVTLSELRSVKASGMCEVDCELESIWKVRPAKDVELIRKACRWMLDDDSELDMEALMNQITSDCNRVVDTHNRLIRQG